MTRPRFLLSVHRWIALAFAPLLLLQSATGAVLLFRDELTGLTLPTGPSEVGRIAPLSALAKAATDAYPDLRLARLFYPAGGTSAAFAQLEGGRGMIRYASIDPANARVISSGSIWRFPHEAALQVHFRLLSGPTGIALVALNGLALALLAVSGLWQWWPGARRVPQALKDTAKAPARLKLRAWHRSVGAVLAFVLLTSSATGIMLAVPNLPFASASSEPPAKPVALDGGAIDRGMALAQATYPGAGIRDVRFAADGKLTVNLLAPRGGRWAVDVVTVSAAGQRVTSALPYERNEALWLTALPIHTGDLIGPAGRWPMLAAAFALAFLALSGPIAWWRSKRSDSQ